MENKNQKQTNRKNPIPNDITDLAKIDKKEVEKTIKEGTEVLDSLSNKDREKVKRLITVQSFSGPLPHPAMLQQYENIKKGFAERIVKMAEKEQDHLTKHNDDLLKYQARDSLLGALFAFLTIIIMFVGSFILYMKDKNIGGFVSLIAGITACASIFLQRKNDNK